MPVTVVDPLIDLVRGRHVAVLSGAGCSTESGIPDYGGLHSTTRRTRIQYRAFMNDPLSRARYWARSALGWARVAEARPNPAHVAIAQLETAGVVTGVITQNVDGLHRHAGSRRVVELHGTLSRVRCVDCGSMQSRAGLQSRLLDANPFLHDLAAARAAPDGDAEVRDGRLGALVVPACDVCGGILKPDVVFFGENVPKERVARAWSIFEDAELLLVVGTSLAVFSGYRFVLRAAREDRPVAIVNDGETRGDAHASVRLWGRAGDLLPRIVDAVTHGEH